MGGSGTPSRVVSPRVISRCENGRFIVTTIIPQPFYQGGLTQDKPSLYTGFVGEDRSQRVRKRLRVLYGEGADQRLGFTTNLSRTGCCINAALVFAAGTRVRGTLEL